MMIPRHTITIMETLDLMLESAIKDHSSHEQRNKALFALRCMLDNWIRTFRSYQDEEDKEAKALLTLEAIYQLCIWKLEHETHVEVKTRLFMARNIIARFLTRRNEALLSGIERRSREAKIRTEEEKWRAENQEPSPELDDLPF